MGMLRGPCAPRCCLTLNRVFFSQKFVHMLCMGCGGLVFASGLTLELLGLAPAAPTFVFAYSHLQAEKGGGYTDFRPLPKTKCEPDVCAKFSCKAMECDGYLVLLSDGQCAHHAAHPLAAHTEPLDQPGMSSARTVSLWI